MPPGINGSSLSHVTNEPERRTSEDMTRRRSSEFGDRERNLASQICAYLSTFDVAHADSRHRFHVDVTKGRRKRAVRSELATVVGIRDSGYPDHISSDHVLLCDNGSVVLGHRLPFDGSTVVEVASEGPERILSVEEASSVLAAGSFKTWYEFPSLPR